MSEKLNSPKTAGKVWIGVDIGGTKTAVVLCSEPPAILERIAFPTLPEHGPDHALTLIRQTIHQMIQTHELRPGQVEAIGISCGGPLDRKRGVIQSPPNLPTWDDVPIVDVLKHESIAAWKTKPMPARSPSIDSEPGRACKILFFSPWEPVWARASSSEDGCITDRRTWPARSVTCA